MIEYHGADDDSSLDSDDEDEDDNESETVMADNRRALIGKQIKKLK